MTDKPNTHGGPRPNSGRKPAHLNEPGVSTTMNLPPSVREFLRQYGSYSDGVMRLVLASREWKQWRRENS